MDSPRSKNLFYRKLRQNDESLFLSLLQDPHIKKFLLEDMDVSREEIQMWISESEILQKQWGLGLYLIYKGKNLIGYGGFTKAKESPGFAHIVYAFPREQTGQGFASEVCAALLEYSLFLPQKISISAVVHPLNIHSIRVLEKNKFVYRGSGPGELDHLLLYHYAP